MPEVAVTGAHPLIWASTGQQRRLGTEARRMFERAQTGNGAIFVPTVALAEIGFLIRRGRIRIPEGLSTWIATLSESQTCFPTELNVEVVLHAQSLYAIPDPFDRLIAATAVHLECPLITRDSEISEAAGVEVLW